MQLSSFRLHDMEGIEAAETRQRLTKWIQEGQSLFGLFQGVLEENEQLKARVGTSEQECERLRQENAGLQREREEFVASIGKLMAEILRPLD